MGVPDSEGVQCGRVCEDEVGTDARKELSPATARDFRGRGEPEVFTRGELELRFSEKDWAVLSA